MSCAHPSGAAYAQTPHDSFEVHLGLGGSLAAASSGLDMAAIIDRLSEAGETGSNEPLR